MHERTKISRGVFGAGGTKKVFHLSIKETRLCCLRRCSGQHTHQKHVRRLHLNLSDPCGYF